MRMTERYELVNKYNPNELIQDNYNVMDGCVQIYSAESVEYELNDLFNRLKNIGEICDDCLQLENIYGAGYIVAISEIKKIVENSIDELSEINWDDVE